MSNDCTKQIYLIFSAQTEVHGDTQQGVLTHPQQAYKTPHFTSTASLDREIRYSWT